MRSCRKFPTHLLRWELFCCCVLGFTLEIHCRHRFKLFSREFLERIEVHISEPEEIEDSV